MLRTVTLVALATLVVAPMMSLAPTARAQIGNIFSNAPPRPPGNVPGPQDQDEEEVPDLPAQGRILPIPNRPQPELGAPPPGSVQSQPLPPPPGTTIVPQTQPGVATAPPSAAPGGTTANAPASPNPLPGLPQGQRQPRGTPATGAPPTPATLYSARAVSSNRYSLRIPGR